MKHFCFYLSVLLLAACTSTSPLTSTYEVNTATFSETLRYLSSDALEGRNTGSEGIAKAATYLENQLKAHAIQPYFSTYYDTLVNATLPAYNVVGYIEGTDPKLKNEWVILGAHYDHIGISTDAPAEDQINNGANDNASGVTVLTEVMKALSQEKKLKRSVLIVYFSAEEKGLLGSYHLAQQLNNQKMKVYTMLNFEMLGVPMNYDFDAYLTGYDFSNMAQELNKYAGFQLVGRSEKAEKMQLFKASDNYPFYEKMNIPAQTLSSFDFTNFDYYHHVKDEYSQMNLPYMVALTQKIIPVVIQMINAPTNTIKMNP